MHMKQLLFNMLYSVQVEVKACKAKAVSIKTNAVVTTTIFFDPLAV